MVKNRQQRVVTLMIRSFC